MRSERTKVLYIAGWGRSGSTILGNTLGQLDGFFFVGEILNIWRHYLLEDRLCACGQPASQCEVWAEVIAHAFAHMDQATIEYMDELRKRSIRNRYIPEMLIAPGRRRLQSRLAPYLANLERLYAAVRETTGARIIVDSSKRPTYGLLLEMVPSIELYVLHLVRDARAVAHSWQRRKVQQNVDGREVVMQRLNATSSTLRWDLLNAVTELFWRHAPARYMQLRYEDFIDHPQPRIRDIGTLVGEPLTSLPFVDERTVDLDPNHAIWGNPTRFRQGPVALRRDDIWRTRMRTVSRVGVTALAWPLLLRYGYPLRTEEQ